MSSAPENNVSPAEVAERARLVIDEHNAVQLATMGGAWSPWILGAYMARARSELAQELHKLAPDTAATALELDLVLMVERHGKTLANLQADPRVALAISHNDATRDFIQASGRALLLPAHFEGPVINALTAKMPWYKLYTPCVPVGIALSELFVTSFPLGWMPAQRLQVRTGR